MASTEGGEGGAAAANCAGVGHRPKVLPSADHGPLSLGTTPPGRLPARTCGGRRPCWPWRATTAAGTREGVPPGGQTPATRNTRTCTAMQPPSVPLTTDADCRPQCPQAPGPPDSLTGLASHNRRRSVQKQPPRQPRKGAARRDVGDAKPPWRAARRHHTAPAPTKAATQVAGGPVGGGQGNCPAPGGPSPIWRTREGGTGQRPEVLPQRALTPRAGAPPLPAATCTPGHAGEGCPH